MEMQVGQDYIPQREALFENHHVRDKAFFKEFYASLLLKRPIMIASGILMLVCFVFNLLSELILEESSLYLFILPPAIFALALFSYWINVRTMTRREAELSSGEPLFYLTRIYAEELEMTSKLGGELKIALSTIKTVKATKQYLLLGTAAKQYFPIKKDGFTVGTCEELCAFLRAKGYRFTTK